VELRRDIDFARLRGGKQLVNHIQNSDVVTTKACIIIFRATLRLCLSHMQTQVGLLNSLRESDRRRLRNMKQAARTQPSSAAAAAAAAIMSPSPRPIITLAEAEACSLFSPFIKGSCCYATIYLRDL
jgi:hypothetical protein